MAETTEEALRKALDGLLKHHGGGEKRCGHDYECICAWSAARAALALPVTTTRVEYRVTFDVAGCLDRSRTTCWSLDGAQETLKDCVYPRARIETRTVPEPGPWLPYQEDEKI